ncbi:hypothetical protein BC835DRAFT_1423439 [Cytidiella melzeri]|nr:hypothetical protein BC835DRAFT_1423439 [Cytidiella melzeri]
MSLSSFFTSFTSTVYADAPAEKEESKEPAQEEQEASEPEAAKEGEGEEEEEEEEEEPEDVLPALQEECKESAACAAASKHFAHCQEKVSAGEGFHGENCIEEFCMCLVGSSLAVC